MQHSGPGFTVCQLPPLPLSVYTPASPALLQCWTGTSRGATGTTARACRCRLKALWHCPGHPLATCTIRPIPMCECIDAACKRTPSADHPSRNHLLLATCLLPAGAQHDTTKAIDPSAPHLTRPMQPLVKYLGLGYHGTLQKYTPCPATRLGCFPPPARLGQGTAAAPQPAALLHQIPSCHLNPSQPTPAQALP
jgi:hypothetical protein